MLRQKMQLLAIVTGVFIASTAMQWQARSVGLFYDDFLVFRHYDASLLIQSWWSDIAVLTSPQLWVHVYRPMTLLVHALTFEIFGFKPEGLLVARILMCWAIALCLFVWIRKLGQTEPTAFFGALLFLVFPTNFYAFTWNTEIGAISSLIWLLLSFILTHHYLETDRRRSLVLSCSCWALALLTKEVVVPLGVVFPLLWILFGRRREWKNAIAFSFPFLGLTGIFITARFIVLKGSWGAQGASPDNNAPIIDYAVNYLRFLLWMFYDLPVRYSHNDSWKDWLRLDFLLLLAPLAWGVARLIRTLRGVAHLPSIEKVRALDPTDKQIIVGSAVTLAGGLICCFLPIPRIMFAAALGPVLIVGSLPCLLFGILGNKKLFTGAICTLILGLNALYYSQLIHGKRSEFVRLQTFYSVETYFVNANLFEAWNLRGQTKYLYERLVEADLVEPETGRLRAGPFQTYLISIGKSRPDAEKTTEHFQSFKSAYERLYLSNSSK